MYKLNHLLYFELNTLITIQEKNFVLNKNRKTKFKIAINFRYC